MMAIVTKAQIRGETYLSEAFPFSKIDEKSKPILVCVVVEMSRCYQYVLEFRGMITNLISRDGRTYGHCALRRGCSLIGLINTSPTREAG